MALLKRSERVSKAIAEKNISAFDVQKRAPPLTIDELCAFLVQLLGGLLEKLDCYAFVESSERARDLTTGAHTLSVYIGFDDERQRHFSALLRVWQSRGFEFDVRWNPAMMMKINLSASARTILMLKVAKFWLVAAIHAQQFSKSLRSSQRAIFVKYLVVGQAELICRQRAFSQP